MEMTQKLVRRVRAQFGWPHGTRGPDGGWVMAHRSSNRRRNAWAVSLLEIERDDRVLEIGFGPGVAIRVPSRIAVDGHVCGIDHSEVMARPAAKRTAADVRLGRVDLRLGRAESLPAFEAPFDKVLAVNAMQSWDRPAEQLAELRRVLRTGGRIALAYQPRGHGASDQAAANGLCEVGFCEMRLETVRLKPAVVCALGGNGPVTDAGPWSRAR